ncbi:helix-turn-helix domain-containing protein [Halanaerobacter jeridensis]|uniref:MerR family glutamine synthetase transcriptional repressor n=1 Tax=Halanaerobacter jeridensis TaxID=706427 RepID=A0A939BPL3_9FIRM|nr:MerR family transcriptional regulator [Halanaerobacter jeridensis]MBM7557212.1 MerR family glutamine synthetase transcriptional repressor [Halanaerobacter jeridensis]
MVDIDPDTPIYSIGAVKEETDLSGRQIRYYEEAELIKPARTEGNQRIYSENDIEKLKKIKNLLAEGMKIAGIKKQLGTAEEDQAKKSKKTEEAKKAVESAYDGRPLDKFNRGSEKGLSSLYPVSNRAQLVKILKNNKGENDK